MESHLKGDLTEAIVVAELKRRQIPVAIPFGDNDRWDLVVETPSGNLLRIQVKTGWMHRGAVTFKGASQHTNSQGNTVKKYEDDVDHFIVYSEEMDEFYLVDEQEVGHTMMLRVEEPDQVDHTINWANDFEFDARWPPDESDEFTTPSSSDPLVREAVSSLTDAGSEVYTPANDGARRRLIAVHENEIYRVSVTPGWYGDGRIKFVDRSELPVDCFFVYCKDLDQLYVISDDDFDSTIVLRVKEPKKRDRRVNYAQDYEFGVNWPPNREPHPDHPLNPGILESVNIFERKKCEVSYDTEDGTNQTLIVETPSCDRYRIRIEKGWKEEGRIRFVPNGDDIDYYVVYHDELEELYIVSDDAFNASFTFRVDPPKAADSTINWAEDYLLEENWPPEEY